MLTFEPARVTPSRARLRAETGGPRAYLYRQFGFVDRLIAVQAGQLDLGRRGEPEIRALKVKHVGGEFRQLTDAGQRSGVDQKRRKNFGVAVLARVHVQKEIRQSAFEPGA